MASMTEKPITWEEIEAIFDRCGEMHLSPNLLEALAAQVDRSPEGQDHEDGLDRNDESAVPKGCAQKVGANDTDT